MTIGIIGYGAFGSFVHELAKHYLPEAVVKIHSTRNEPDGVTFFTIEAVCACDIVVPAVPISALAETFETIGKYARPETIVIDVATVKEYPVGLLAPYEGKFKYIATHPMFGPYSYLKKGKSLSGLKIVICERTVDNSTYQRAGDFMKSLGITILETTAEDHDKTLAETLFLTHLIGQMVTVGGFRRSEIDTVSFGFLMDAVESVQNDTSLFRDVYRYNKYCKEVLGRIVFAYKTVSKGLDGIS